MTFWAERMAREDFKLSESGLKDDTEVVVVFDCSSKASRPRGAEALADQRRDAWGQDDVRDGDSPAESQYPVVETAVAGNVILEGNMGPVVVAGSTIDGNLRTKDHEFTGDPFGLIAENSIGGSLVLKGNDGQATIRGNTIGGHLTCSMNQPNPVGSDNTANQKKG